MADGEGGDTTSLRSGLGAVTVTVAGVILVIVVDTDVIVAVEYIVAVSSALDVWTSLVMVLVAFVTVPLVFAVVTALVDLRLLLATAEPGLVILVLDCRYV